MEGAAACKLLELPGDSARGVGRGRGTEEGRAGSATTSLLPLLVGWISPFAAVSLFVKDEIAHPAQEVSLDVPMRAALGLFAELASAAVGGGNIESTIVLLCFRTRCRYKSRVLFA
jgi:hypothetical protein